MIMILGRKNPGQKLKRITGIEHVLPVVCHQSPSRPAWQDKCLPSRNSRQSKWKGKGRILVYCVVSINRPVHARLQPPRPFPKPKHSPRRRPNSMSTPKIPSDPSLVMQPPKDLPYVSPEHSQNVHHPSHGGVRMKTLVVVSTPAYPFPLRPA
jgi:hypothetical protein